MQHVSSNLTSTALQYVKCTNTVHHPTPLVQQILVAHLHLYRNELFVDHMLIVKRLVRHYRWQVFNHRMYLDLHFNSYFA